MKARFEAGRAGALFDGRRRAGRDDAALGHRSQPVEALGLLHIGGGDQHAHALAARPDAVDQIPELPARQRIDAGRGLVEDEQVGIVDQRAAQAELLFHAAGKLAHRPVGEGGEPGGAQQFVDARPPLGPVLTIEPAEEMQVLGDRQSRIEIAPQPLRHEGDAGVALLPMRGRGDIAAQHAHLAGLQPLGAGDEAQQGRFAGTIGSDQPGHAAGGNRHRDVLQRRDLAIAMRHVPELGDDRAIAGRFVPGAPDAVHCGSFGASSAGHSASWRTFT